MATSKDWKKLENEDGYPCYLEQSTGKQQFDHPEFVKIKESLNQYDEIKHSVYRIAFKIFELQKYFHVPPLRIASGVFARHQLSLSETSLSLDTTELEAVLLDIYFAAQKEGVFHGDVDLTVDLMINLLLNVYDKKRKEPIRVLAAKTLLIILSEESITDKWAALANSCSDHNGCVSPRRLAALLTHVTALPAYLGTPIDNIQADVDACFSKNAGMLGMTARAVAEWGASHSSCGRFLTATQRIVDSRSSGSASCTCAKCSQPLIQVLKFKCTKCDEVYFCEKCYLYGKEPSIPGHKKTHIVQEVVDGEVYPTQCLSLMKSMRRFFFCTKTKKKVVKGNKVADKRSSVEVKKELGKPIFTSTVGKASGHSANVASILQDIINQMETQNRALKELSSQLDTLNNCDGVLKRKVDAHFNQVSTQINRLKIVKENLALTSPTAPESTKQDKPDRPQAFDLFSPIAVEEKETKITDKAQPRVLSLDSGNFSATSRHESQNLLTMSGDALKPVVVHATSDSISTVSMQDISSWHNETESLAPDKRQVSKMDSASQSICATERKYAADIRSVETSNDKMKELNADLDTVLDRLQQILTNNFAIDDSCFDNTQLRETASEMEDLLGSLIRGVEQRATLNTCKGLV